MCKEVYRIIDRETDCLKGAYSRAYHTEYDFDSVSSARSSNCYDIYKDKAKYKIAKYKVTYELIDDDCDKPTEKETQRYLINKEEDARELIAKDKRLRELAFEQCHKSWDSLHELQKFTIQNMYHNEIINEVMDREIKKVLSEYGVYKIEYKEMSLMGDERYSKELVYLAVDLWSRDIESIAELNHDAVEDISNKYGEDCLSTLDAILTRNWDKWNQEMEEYFQKQKKSENKNEAMSTL